jgi:hypothetical protein
MEGALYSGCLRHFLVTCNTKLSKTYKIAQILDIFKMTMLHFVVIECFNVTVRPLLNFLAGIMLWVRYPEGHFIAHLFTALSLH